MAKAEKKKNKTLVFDPFADLDSQMVQDVLGYRPSVPPDFEVEAGLAEPLVSMEPAETEEPAEAILMLPALSDEELAEVFGVSLQEQAGPETGISDQASPLLELLMSELDDVEPLDVLSSLVAEPCANEQDEQQAQLVRGFSVDDESADDMELSVELFKLAFDEEAELAETLFNSETPGEPELPESMTAPMGNLDEESDLAREHDLLEEIVRQIDDELYQPDHSGDVFGLARTASPDAATLKRHVVFSVGSTEYAVPILTVSEVVRPLKITPVPNVPEWVLGVANLRGDIISVVDLRLLFGQAAPESLPSNRMLVVHSQNEEVTTGLIVDRASGIFDLPQEQIRSPSAPIDDKVSPFMQGVSEVNDRLLVVLDLNGLLLSTEMQQFQ
jgi:purine-binding chemotaxis protein CheW